MVAADFALRGWARIGPRDDLAGWSAAALPAARAVLAAAPAAAWRCGGTWFPGVGALACDAAGRVAGGPPLPPLPLPPPGPLPLHPAQLSVTRAGYPKPWPGESAAAFGYRLRRDAAHLDGLLPVGPGRRRMLREPHAWILGLPLTAADPEAAPLVVWDGSHRILGPALAAALAPYPPADWPDVDLTDVCHAARRAVFDRCLRVPLPAMPGEALLLHRHLLHGIAPWPEGAASAPEGRAIAYFRPLLPAGAAGWPEPDPDEGC